MYRLVSSVHQVCYRRAIFGKREMSRIFFPGRCRTAIIYSALFTFSTSRQASVCRIELYCSGGAFRPENEYNRRCYYRVTLARRVLSCATCDLRVPAFDVESNFIGGPPVGARNSRLTYFKSFRNYIDAVIIISIRL